MFGYLYKRNSLLCLLIIVIPVLISGILLRIYVIDVPELSRICASSNPASWCGLRDLVTNSRIYIISIIFGVIALRYASVNWSALSIATGLFGLFSFNPYWSISTPDWSIAGLVLGIFAFMRCQ